MRKSILISALGWLLVPIAHLHAQGETAGDAPDRAEARDLTELTFRFDPAGDARLLRGISLGLLQDGADPSAQDDAAPIPERVPPEYQPVAIWARGGRVDAILPLDQSHRPDGQVRRRWPHSRP